MNAILSAHVGQPTYVVPILKPKLCVYKSPSRLLAYNLYKKGERIPPSAP